ncbi:MAG: Calx-beta domain-containing protein [Planctomycetaceae bacterium]
MPTWLATSDGSATIAGLDYAAANKTVTFAPGTTTQTITILVTGGTTIEADETLFVTLSNPINADIQDAAGQGTILNDDMVTVTRTLYAIDDLSQNPFTIAPMTAAATRVGSVGIGQGGADLRAGRDASVFRLIRVSAIGLTPPRSPKRSTTEFVAVVLVARVVPVLLEVPGVSTRSSFVAHDDRRSR